MVNRLRCLVATALIVSVAAALRAPAQDQEPVYRLNFETEAFDGIPTFGNWHPEKGTGWYIKEHVHASSQAIGICDAFNVGAEMFKKLDRLYPAGKLNALVYVYTMRGGTTNAVDFAIGTRKDGEFRVSASEPLEWGQTGSGYVWVGGEMEAKEPWDTIRVKAVKIGRTGIGDNPEQDYPYIFFDRVLLTNDPAVQVSRDNRGAVKVVLPPAEVSDYVSDDDKRAEAWLKAQTPAALLPALPAGNVLPDSGFELGFEPWWFTPDGIPESFYMSFGDLDAKEAHTGQYSLRVTLAPHLNGFTGRLACWPFLVKPATKYQLSFYAKTNADGATCTLTSYCPQEETYSTGRFNDAWTTGWQKTAMGKYAPGAQWKRFSVNVTTAAMQEMMYLHLDFASKGEGAIWLDSFQLSENGEGQYNQRTPVEAGISWRQTAGVFYSNRPLEFTMAACSEAEEPSEAVFDYEIYNLQGTKQAGGEARLPVAGKGTFEKTLTIPFGRRGAFLMNSPCFEHVASRGP